MSMYAGHPVYDYFEHVGGVTDFPAGRGARTTSAGSGVAPLGKRIELHSVIFLNTAAGNLTFLKGDGVTPYFTNVYPVPGGVNGAQAAWDIRLNDGLAISGGSAGSWIISYRIID